MKYFLRPPIFLSLFLSASICIPQITFASPAQQKSITQDFANTIIKLSNRTTGIAPSHYGHPGYESLAFLYDITINAMILKVAGDQKAAEKVMDYFAARLRISQDSVIKKADSNNIYGVLKVFNKEEKDLGFVNSLNVSALQEQGLGQLEFLTTPGPVSFAIMSFLQINQQKYLPYAVLLGETLLSMQRKDGAIFDGDRARAKVHTEPHVDAANALYQLYEVTKDVKWKNAGDMATDWFRKNVYIVSNNEIYQGIWEYGPSMIFATDVYSWTMAGRFGDMFTMEELEGLTQKMLTRILTKVDLELPDGKRKTIVMSDFADPRDYRVLNQREGFHPMGSPEWSGGVILALQKNAVRFWENGYEGKARFYKAIADELLSNVLKSSYRVKGMMMFPYATGQGIEVGHGWKTPYFYVKNKKDPIKGGSLVGGWPIFPLNGFNPFILNDQYLRIYHTIDVSSSYTKKASAYIEKIVAPHTFIEVATTEFKLDKRDQIVEPGQFNAIAWRAFNSRNYKQAIHWAQRVVDDPVWMQLALKEEALKARNIGGIIDYPWGKTYRNNDNPRHNEIWKYPLLNEVSTAMWLLAASNYELGKIKMTKHWLKRIITEVPHHQIADVIINPETGKKDLIRGYWNAVVSWAYNPSRSNRDVKMAKLIKEMGIELKVPPSVDLN